MEAMWRREKGDVEAREGRAAGKGAGKLMRFHGFERDIMFGLFMDLSQCHTFSAKTFFWIWHDCHTPLKPAR
jgi:hypothetical protein